MSKENGIDFLEWQKKNLEKKEIEEIYDKPKNPEREFEGVDEDENNKEAVPEKSKDEKIEEELLKGEDKKRRGESTEIENKIEDDSKDDTKKQFKIGKKKIAEVKRGQVEESLKKTKPENVELVQELKAKNEGLETATRKETGEWPKNIIKNLEGIARTYEILEDVVAGKRKTRKSEEDINNSIESLVSSVMENRNAEEIEEIMNDSDMNGEQKSYIREAIEKYGMEIEKGTEKASVEISVDDYFEQCKEDETKLRTEEGGEKTFVIARIPKEGNIILKNTEAENKKEARLNKEFLYELNNVKISREDLVNLEKNLEENRSLFDDNKLHSYAIEGTVNDLLKNNKDAEEIDVSDYSAVIRALEIVEKDEELRKEEAESRAKEEVKRKIGEAQRRAKAMKKITDERIEEAESGKEVKDIEGSIKKQLRDIPNAEDFKISLKEKGAERKEEIKGAEAEEIPDIKSEEDVEAMSLEELDEKIKKMSEYLEKMEEKAKSMGIEDISKSHTYQEFEEYLDDLENAKKIKEEAEEEAKEEVSEEKPAEPEIKEPEKIELNEAEKEYIRKTKEIEKLRKENEGLLSIPWEDLTEEEKEIVERIEELEIGRVVDKGSAIMTNHIDELERKIGTPKEKKGILEAQKEYIESKKLLIGVEMLEKGLRMKMERSKKRRRIFPSVGKFGKAIKNAVKGRLKDPFKKEEKEKTVKTTSETNKRFSREKRKDLNSMSEQELTDEFEKVLEDIIDLTAVSNKKTEGIIENVYKVDIEKILKKINSRDNIKNDHNDIKETFKESRRRIGELPNDLNNPKEYLNRMLDKVNNIFKEKLRDNGEEAPNPSEDQPNRDSREELLKNLKDNIKKDLEELENEKLNTLEDLISAAEFAGIIENNISIKKLIDKLPEYSSDTKVKDVISWVEKYKNDSEAKNIKLEDIKKFIDDIKRSRV